MDQGGQTDGPAVQKKSGLYGIFSLSLSLFTSRSVAKPEGCSGARGEWSRVCILRRIVHRQRPRAALDICVDKSGTHVLLRALFFAEHGKTRVSRKDR